MHNVLVRAFDLAARRDPASRSVVGVGDRVLVALEMASLKPQRLYAFRSNSGLFDAPLSSRTTSEVRPWSILARDFAAHACTDSFPGSTAVAASHNSA